MMTAAILRVSFVPVDKALKHACVLAGMDQSGMDDGNRGEPVRIDRLGPNRRGALIWKIASP